MRHRRVVSTPGLGETFTPVYYVGGPPILGYRPAVAQIASGICDSPLADTAWITDTRLLPTDPRDCGILSWLIYPGVVGAWRYRVGIDLPSRPPRLSHIEVRADGVLQEINFNGNAVASFSPPTLPVGYTSYSGTIDPAFLLLNATNLLEVVTLAPLRFGTTIENGTTALCFIVDFAYPIVRLTVGPGDRVRQTVCLGQKVRLTIGE